MKITFITTGGTIDKDYSSSAGTYNFEIGEPAINRILNKINPNFETKIIQLLKKDSLDMTDNDREKIYQTCQNSPSSKIIITHGTDTMKDTARKLSDLENKVIVLTGATKPEKFTDSDAMFNLGLSIGALDFLQNGVYIAMNGCVYKWNQCKKNILTGQFTNSS